LSRFTKATNFSKYRRGAGSKEEKISLNGVKILLDDKGM
jgi:hypothetical protein